MIESSNGYMAIIPKNMASWVKEHIKSGNHAVVDHYVKGLREVKPGAKKSEPVQQKPGAPNPTIAKPVDIIQNVGGFILEGKNK